jgi:dihydrofolate reductase
MPKIIVNAFLTLDGVVQAPGGPEEDREGGFPHGGWQAPYVDDVMGRLVTEGMADADGFLLGRKTYEIFANHWPKYTDPGDPIASALNSRPKYVVSRRLERVTWNNSRLVQGDVVAELQKLRKEPGRTVHTWGSTELFQTLAEHDLVDEYRLFHLPARARQRQAALRRSRRARRAQAGGVGDHRQGRRVPLLPARRQARVRHDRDVARPGAALTPSPRCPRPRR